MEQLLRLSRFQMMVAVTLFFGEVYVPHHPALEPDSVHPRQHDGGWVTILRSRPVLVVREICTGDQVQPIPCFTRFNYFNHLELSISIFCGIFATYSV